MSSWTCRESGNESVQDLVALAASGDVSGLLLRNLN